MSKFWELLEKSIIVQSFVTALMTIVLAVMWTAPLWCNRTVEIPTEVYSIAGVIYGFWFGTKVSYVQSKQVESKAKTLDEITKRMGLDS